MDGSQRAPVLSGIRWQLPPAALRSAGMEHESPAPIRLKACMVGSHGVGKTSLVRRFVHSVFGQRYHETIGVKIDTKTVQVGGREVVLVLWDMAGLDRLDSLTESYLRGASGYLLVADGTREATLYTALELQAAVDRLLGAAPFACLLNKSDLEDEWELAGADAELAGRGWDVVVTSAKTGAGVEEAFTRLAGRMLPAA